MFTKHLQEYDLKKLVTALKSIGLDGADLCVRPGYPVTPENCDRMLKEAVNAFAAEGMSIPLVTTPGNFRDPAGAMSEKLFAACAAAGVKLIKLGYWVLEPSGSYDELFSECRRRLEGFAKLAAKYAVKAVSHTHSGSYMGLNASHALLLLNGLDPASIGVFLDAGHLSLCGEPMYMAIGIVKKYLSCFAFKDIARLDTKTDSVEANVTETRKLGWGGVNWNTVVKSVIAAEVQELPISLHSEYNMPADSVVDMTRIDLRYIKELFAKEGVK